MSNSNSKFGVLNEETESFVTHPNGENVFSTVAAAKDLRDNLKDATGFRVVKIVEFNY